jgi:hypothetical protein
MYNLGLTPLFKQISNKQKTRIFRPVEIQAIRKILKEEKRKQFDVLLVTGMRFIEFKRFYYHPEWIDNNGRFIHLPIGAVKKKRTEFKSRSVRLSSLGAELVPRLFETNKLTKSRGCWDSLLKRVAIKAELNPEGISVKSTRKTWESWLLAKYSKRALEIWSSQGHNDVVSYKHYMNTAFIESDLKDMEFWTAGYFPDD